MTFFNFNNPSETNYNNLNYESLRPPLRLREITKNLKYHWCLYSSNEFSLKKRITFIILHILQRVSYNLGWLISYFKIGKKITDF